MTRPCAVSHPPLPGSLQRNPRLGQLAALRGRGPRRGALRQGGAGAGHPDRAGADRGRRTATVAWTQVRMLAASTARSPDEAVTSGSLSVQESGAALRQACAEARAAVPAGGRAPRSTARRRPAVADGEFLRAGRPPRPATGTLAEPPAGPRSQPGGRAQAPATGRHRRQPARGSTCPPRCSAGRASSTTWRCPACCMPACCGRRRRLRGWLAARPAAVRRGAGRARVVRDGSLLGGGGGTSQAQADARASARGGWRWQRRGRAAAGRAGAGGLAAAPARGDHAGAEQAAHGAEPARRARCRAPATAGPIWPTPRSRLPARWRSSTARGCRSGRHSQGIYKLRTDLALALRLAPEDDHGAARARAPAAMATTAPTTRRSTPPGWRAPMPGQPVRVLWTPRRRTAWAPFGPADAGRPAGRRGRRGNVRAGATASAQQRPQQPARPRRHAGAAGQLAYGRAVSAAAGDQRAAGRRRRRRAQCHALLRLPGLAGRTATACCRCRCAPRRCARWARMRTCSRSRASWTNWPRPPAATRWNTACATCSDPRARAVLSDAAGRAGWPGERPAEGGGMGMGFARYKNTGAWCAVVAEIEAGVDVRVQAADASRSTSGTVINPDGVRNQIEGGAIQAMSWTLKEAVRFDGRARHQRQLGAATRCCASPKCRQSRSASSASGEPVAGRRRSVARPDRRRHRQCVARALGCACASCR